jgi:trypsin
MNYLSKQRIRVIGVIVALMFLSLLGVARVDRVSVGGDGDAGQHSRNGQLAAGVQREKVEHNQITLERGTERAFQRMGGANQADSPVPKIVGGTEVPDGKYPFMTHLDIEILNNGQRVSCGGSLIDEDSVLTAAHCLVWDSEIRVNVEVGGTMIGQGQARFATNYFVHPFYNKAANSSYDVAVLKLESPITGIQPINLAAASQDNLETPGRKLTVAGWGTTSEGGTGSDRMLEVRVPVVSDAGAQAAYASLNDPLWEYFSSLMVAAGKKGKDSCQGDSGGPLFDPRTSTQVGIVSYGAGCARAGFPGAYTEVNNPEISQFIVDAASS